MICVNLSIWHKLTCFYRKKFHILCIFWVMRVPYIGSAAIFQTGFNTQIGIKPHQTLWNVIFLIQRHLLSLQKSWYFSLIYSTSQKKMLIVRKPHERLRNARNISGYYATLHKANNPGHIICCANWKNMLTCLIFLTRKHESVEHFFIEPIGADSWVSRFVPFQTFFKS